MFSEMSENWYHIVDYYLDVQNYVFIAGSFVCCHFVFQSMCYKMHSIEQYSYNLNVLTFTTL